MELVSAIWLEWVRVLVLGRAVDSGGYEDGVPGLDELEVGDTSRS